MSYRKQNFTDGQILKAEHLNYIESAIEAISDGVADPTDAQVHTAVQTWLDDHPEATTSVVDGSISTQKLADGAVTLEKTDDMVKKVLVDCGAQEIIWTIGKTLNSSTGVEESNAYCAVSSPVLLNVGDGVDVLTGTAGVKYAYYGEDGSVFDSANSYTDTWSTARLYLGYKGYYRLVISFYPTDTKAVTSSTLDELLSQIIVRTTATFGINGSVIQNGSITYEKLHPDIISQLSEEIGDLGPVDEEQISQAVNDWLDEHPEATTTVEDGSITYEKLHPDVVSQLSNKNIVGTSIGEKCAEFSSLMNETDNVESFVFFADPHLAEASGYETRMQEYLETIRTYYYGIPASFILCGGDWIGNSDTRDNACFKLGYIDGLMRRHFNRFYHVVGNHDTNQQGVDETGGVWTGILTQETVRNLWFREEGKNYYSFDGANTKFYVLDSWKEGGDADYYWEQIAWLAEKLKSDNPDNVAIALHIGFVSSGDSYITDTLATNVLSLCEAFNSATTITLNGTAYDFTGCTGKVRFALCGHIHDDYVLLKNGIPMIATTNTRAGNTVTFDMCLVDYDSDTMNMVRVGSGSNRTISLTTGEILEDTDDETGSGETINIEYKIGDNIVFLPRVNHQGGTSLTYEQPARAVIVSTVSENGASEYGAISGTNAEPYYPIAIPTGAKYVSVTCPGLIPTFDYTDAGGSLKDTSNWLSEGWGSHTIPDGCSYFIVKFKNPDESAFATDYDASEIVVKISSDPISEDTGDSDTGDDTGNEEIATMVFLNQTQWNGLGMVYPSTRRSIMVSSTASNTALTDVNDSITDDYYAIPIPKGVANITVVSEKLQFCVYELNDNNTTIINSSWLDSGNTHALSGSSTRFILVFRYSTETAFSDVMNVEVEGVLNGDNLTINVVKISDDSVSSAGTVGGKFVFLPRVNHQGGTYLTYEQPARALIVSTVSENGAVEYGASGGTNAVSYYPIAIPSGKTSITVTCPGLICAVCYIDSTGSETSSSGWLSEGGGSPTIPDGVNYFILKFKNPDESEFTTDYDASGITWEFS